MFVCCGQRKAKKRRKKEGSEDNPASSQAKQIQEGTNVNVIEEDEAIGQQLQQTENNEHQKQHQHQEERKPLHLHPNESHTTVDEVQTQTREMPNNSKAIPNAEVAEAEKGNEPTKSGERGKSKTDPNPVDTVTEFKEESEMDVPIVQEVPVAKSKPYTQLPPVKLKEYNVPPTIASANTYFKNGTKVDENGFTIQPSAVQDSPAKLSSVEQLPPIGHKGKLSTLRHFVMNFQTLMVENREEKLNVEGTEARLPPSTAERRRELRRKLSKKKIERINESDKPQVEKTKLIKELLDEIQREDLKDGFAVSNASKGLSHQMTLKEIGLMSTLLDQIDDDGIQPEDLADEELVDLPNGTEIPQKKPSISKQGSVGDFTKMAKLLEDIDNEDSMEVTVGPGEEKPTVEIAPLTGKPSFQRLETMQVIQRTTALLFDMQAQVDDDFKDTGGINHISELLSSEGIEPKDAVSDTKTVSNSTLQTRQRSQSIQETMKISKLLEDINNEDSIDASVESEEEKNLKNPVEKPPLNRLETIQVIKRTTQLLADMQTEAETDLQDNGITSSLTESAESPRKDVPTSPNQIHDPEPVMSKLLDSDQTNR